MEQKKDNYVFIISLAVVAVTVIFSLTMPESFKAGADWLFAFFTGKFGWFYMITMTSFVFFCAILAFSRFGSMRLGKDDDRPEYSRFSWFAMLFSAGMGVGLVFWGVAEPLNHWLAPLGAEAGSVEAARFAVKKSVFHWGFHPWANYAVLALGIAYMRFRREKKILISTVLSPVIGEKNAEGRLGKLIDILAIFATIGGVSTSFGLAALQFGSGLNYLFGIEESNLVYTVIIMIVTFFFMLSCITGLDKGIKWLSNINVVIAICLMTMVLILGPTIKIFDNILTSTGEYINYFVTDSLLYDSDNGFFGGWTVFYWAWWIAWAPFVAPFVARISKGRTIREFIAGVMLVPTLVGILWFSIFGALGIATGTEIAGEAIASTSTAIFVVLDQYQAGFLLSIITLLLLGTFYVTSADSATLVLGMLSTDGVSNPPVWKKIVWGFVQAGMALGLIVSGGSAALSMIQTSSIVTSFPFAVIMILCMVAVVKMLQKDRPKPNR